MHTYLSPVCFCVCTVTQWDWLLTVYRFNACTWIMAHRQVSTHACMQYMCHLFGILMRTKLAKYVTLPTRPHTDGHCYVLITPLCWRDAGIAGMCVVASNLQSAPFHFHLQRVPHPVAYRQWWAFQALEVGRSVVEGCACPALDWDGASVLPSVYIEWYLGNVGSLMIMTI